MGAVPHRWAKAARSGAAGGVAGGDQQLPGGVDPDPGQGDQGGGGRADQFLQLTVELVELGLEVLPAPSQGPQGGLGRGAGAG
jgi:hypothetical protein